MRMHRVAWLVLPLLVSCTRPPPDAYQTTSNAKTATIALGNDSTGVACAGQQRANQDVVFYCGNVIQASGRVVSEKAASGTSPVALASASPWRSGIDSQFTCERPTTVQYNGAPAAELQCTRRIGGFLRIALVTVIEGRAYFGDADPGAAAALQRAIGLASNRLKPETAANAPVDGTIGAGIGNTPAVSSADIGEFDSLMYKAAKANLESRFADSEQNYALAADLLADKEGKDTPAAADPLLHQAMQLSNLGRYEEASSVFQTAAKLIDAGRRDANNVLDDTLPATLDLYRGLDLLNQGQPENVRKATDLLRQAESGFARFVRQEDRAPARANVIAGRRGILSAISDLSDAELYRDLESGRAALGLISAKRNLAIALKMQGQLAESIKESEEAEQQAQLHAVAVPQLEARIRLTSAAIYDAKAADDVKRGAAVGAEATQHDRAASLDDARLADIDMNKAYAKSRPAAIADFLLAKQEFAAGNTDNGLAVCSRAIDTLKLIKKGGDDVSRVMPCLDAFHAAKNYPAMFEAAQVAQGGITTTLITEAAAKLAVEGKGTAVGDAFGRQSDSADRFNILSRQLQDLEAQQAGGSEVGDRLRETRQQLLAARSAMEGADADLHKLAPELDQFIKVAVSADEMFKVLDKGDVFATIVLGDDHGWTLVLHDGHIDVVRIDRGLSSVGKLVENIRATMVPDGNEDLKPFDSESSEKLYNMVFGDTAPFLKATKRLIVAPSGPLLSIPFGLLLTAPVKTDLAQAPWLIRNTTIEHVPSATNFVVLHTQAKSSPAERNWIGFGDPLPISRAQAEKLYAGRGCGNSASLLTGLIPLDGAVGELDEVKETLHALPSEELLEAKYTRDAVTKADLKQYKIIHFATHALLPTDIACQDEAAIVMSPPPHAASAADALLTASQVTRLKLNADAVILSACNSGGPEGKTAGESLSGLARSFFYAGSRSLIVTHWEVNDQVTRILVAGMIKHLEASPRDGLAGALAAEEREFLSKAVGDKAVFAHPYYWAPLALIGDGGGHIDLSLAAAEHGGLHTN